MTHNKRLYIAAGIAIALLGSFQAKLAFADALPIGGLDVVASCDQILGWAQDPSATTTPILVGFYIDIPDTAGAAGYAGSVTANQNQGRTDLVSIGAQNSSYTFSIPAKYRDGKTHTLYAYGIDPGGENAALTSSPKTFQCAPTSPPASTLPIQSNDSHTQVQAVGNLQPVFNASTDACGADDMPDTALHAFRSADGTVNLTGNNQVNNYRMVGPALDTVVRNCTPAYKSANDTTFANFDYHEWLFSPYTLDGTTVYALAHDEWYPNVINPVCSPNVGGIGAITLLTSTNAGATYAHPANYKVGVPSVAWGNTFSCTTSVYGDWNVSNIISKGGYYYALYNQLADPNNVANTGTCAMRTANLADASSWQIWTGADWQPMSSTLQCGVLSGLSSWQYTVVESVTYSTYLNLYVAVAIDNSTHIMYSTSSDLLNWSAPQQILGLPVPGQSQLVYGSLIDPTDTSRNFENIGQQPYLYLVRYDTADGSKRDIIRQQIQFTKLTTPDNPPYTSGGGGGGGSTVVLPVISTTTVSLPPKPVTQHSAVCPIISRTLAKATRGTDVLALQKYLISQGLLSADSTTSYFGALTEKAVQKWQTSHSLVSSGSPQTTGWGVVGPRTRAALVQCNR